MVEEFYIWVRVVNSIARSLKLYCDNSVVVFMAKNNRGKSQSKHTNTKYLA